MAEASKLGLLVSRLLDHRGLGIKDLAHLAEIDESMAREIAMGELPSASVLQRIAFILGVRNADLAILAELDASPGIVSSESAVHPMIGDILKGAVRMSRERLEALREMVGSRPHTNGSGAGPHDMDNSRYPAGAGSFVVGMLRNRNLNRLNAVKALYYLGGVGPWSAATISSVASGRRALTDELLCAFATVLAYDAEDLAVFLDVSLAGPCRPQGAASRDVAELLWDLRGLDVDDIRAIRNAV
jgi:transcriptional regulator with XRE-family HTH domain